MRHFERSLTILLFLFVGTVSAQVRPNAHPSQIIMITAPARDSVAVNLTIPSDVDLKTLSAHLNGKDVSARLTSTTCRQANCQQATLTVADGLHGIKNVFSVMAKRNDGSLVSARTRFVGATVSARARAAVANPQAVHANADSALPTLSDFLPPRIAFMTLKFGGYASGSPWYRVGSQNTRRTDPSYSYPGIYTVIVLDRQTLQEKTAAPEKPPNCVSYGTRLKRYLATLIGDDLVIVGPRSSAIPARNGGGEIQS